VEVTLFGMALWGLADPGALAAVSALADAGREVREVCTSSHAPSVRSDDEWLPANGTGATR
jgi:hypothetical protein